MEPQIDSFDEYQTIEDIGVYRRLQPAFKAAWLAALRGGGFHQGSGALRKATPSGDIYCCLGVACHVLGVEPVDDRGNPNTAMPNWHEHEVWQPPSADEPTACTPSWIQEHLANMNDDGDHSFADIADWIEQNL